MGHIGMTTMSASQSNSNRTRIFRHYIRAWEYMTAMCEITPRTWGDLLAQLETRMDDDDTEAEVFLNLPDNIRRLANGAVS